MGHLITSAQRIWKKIGPVLLCFYVLTTGRTDGRTAPYHNTFRRAYKNCSLRYKVVIASPVSAAPSTSSFLTSGVSGMGTINCKTRQDMFKFGNWCSLYQRFEGILVTVRAGGCQTCGTHISVTAWRIFSIRSSMELSRPVVVQCHGHLPICPIWVCPWAKNLSNQAALEPDFAEPISLKPLDGFIRFEVLWNCLDL